MIRKTLLILGLLAGVAVAQPQQVRTSIVAFAPGAPPEGFKAFCKIGEEIKPFVATGSGLSAPISYKGPRRFELRASEQAFAAPPAGQAAPPPLGFVDLPEGANNVLLLVADAGGGKVRLLAYDVSTGSLRAGDYKIFNFTKSTLGINLGKQKLVVKSTQNDVMQDSTWREPGAKGLPLEIYRFEGQNAKKAKESVFEHWPSKRIVMFIFDGTLTEGGLRMLACNVEAPRREAADAAGQ